MTDTTPATAQPPETDPYPAGRRVVLRVHAAADPIPSGATGTIVAYHPEHAQLSVAFDPPHHTRDGLLLLDPQFDSVQLLPEIDPDLPLVTRLIKRAGGVDAQHPDSTATPFSSAEHARAAAGDMTLPVYLPHQAQLRDAAAAWRKRPEDREHRGAEHFPDTFDLLALMQGGMIYAAAQWLAIFEVNRMNETDGPVARWCGRQLHLLRVNLLVGRGPLVSVEGGGDAEAAPYFRPGDLTVGWEKYPGVMVGYSTRVLVEHEVPGGGYEVLATTRFDPNAPRPASYPATPHADRLTRLGERLGQPFFETIDALAEGSDVRLCRQLLPLDEQLEPVYQEIGSGTLAQRALAALYGIDMHEVDREQRAVLDYTRTAARPPGADAAQ